MGLAAGDQRVAAGVVPSAELRVTAVVSRSRNSAAMATK